MDPATSRNSNATYPRIGIWQDIPHPSISRYLSIMRWDFVVLDMQHGPMTYETAYQCIHTLRAGNVAPWVRIPIDSPTDVQRALDIGAQAIVVPMVNSRSTAQELAQAAKYPPLGIRSIGGDCKFHLGKDYPDRANNETQLIVQIEHVDGVQAVEDIMSVPGVDGCFVGPVDLALSMNLPRDRYDDNLEHQGMIRRVLDACRVHGKLACSNTYSPEDAQLKLKDGFQCITQMSEVDLLMRTGTQLRYDLEQYRSREIGIQENRQTTEAK